jgi:hypothetical protein
MYLLIAIITEKKSVHKAHTCYSRIIDKEIPVLPSQCRNLSMRPREIAENCHPNQSDKSPLTIQEKPRIEE